MPKILVFQHVPFEILGTLDPLLKSYGFRIRYVNFDRHPHARPSLEGYDGLVVLGGPMSVDDTEAHPHLSTESELVTEAIERGMPLLGVCLGAQLIARALGARVGPSPDKEIGWHPVRPTEAGLEDPLLGHLGPSERLFQWHGDAFELPPGAVQLASSPGCEHQAFRYGERVYGFQFHLEVDERLIERWLRTPVLKRELAGLPGLDADRVRRDTRLHLARSLRLADRAFEAFVRLFGATRRRAWHPHR
ncbi:MAG: gamma-glutamyl-gamma-aminobutyrate hydrolase family protein [Myxococcota bacterium]